MKKTKNIKNKGQVFTPLNIVKLMLDKINYNGIDILEKHIIDNSCGDGAFLCEIIDRYIQAYIQKNGNINNIENDLHTYIHGIEIDNDVYNDCIKKIYKLTKQHNLQNIKWDIICSDALSINKYNGLMDYVIGNPPYVRVHNLKNQYNIVKSFNFCKTGMTDLYIVFFEIGFNMLNSTGKLCYITPNSYYTSLAGKGLRQYISKNHTLTDIIDFGHFQAFDVTTYTSISIFDNASNNLSCNYYRYNGNIDFISSIDYNNLFIERNNTFRC